MDHEDEMRELHLTQLQCYIRDSTDELDMLQQVCTELLCARLLYCIKVIGAVIVDTVFIGNDDAEIPSVATEKRRC